MPAGPVREHTGGFQHRRLARDLDLVLVGKVDEVLAQAERAGAKIEKPAANTFWGGYSGYFSDPDGHLWEVAWGAFEFNDDGSLIIP